MPHCRWTHQSRCRLRMLDEVPTIVHAVDNQSCERASAIFDLMYAERYCRIWLIIVSHKFKHYESEGAQHAKHASNSKRAICSKASPTMKQLHDVTYIVRRPFQDSPCVA